MAGSSNDAIYQLLETASTVTVPGIPTSLSLSETHNTILATWAAATNNGGEAPTRYDIRIDGGAWIDTGLDLSHEFDNLQPNTEYTIEVAAVNSAGRGAIVSGTVTTDAEALSFGANTIADQVWTVGTAVSVTLPEATGGIGAKTYSLSPTTPANVNFTASTRLLAGDPSATFTLATFTYTATDEDNNTLDLTFTVVVLTPQPPIWQTGSALEESIDAGETTTIDIGAKVSGETTIEEIFGVLLRRWMSFDASTKILSITDAPIFRTDTEITLRFRAGNSDGTRDADLTLTLNGSVLAALHNSLYFYECWNYNTENDRIRVRGTTTTVPEMVDNDYSTYSDEDDIDVDMSDTEGNPTAIDYVFIK